MAANSRARWSIMLKDIQQNVHKTSLIPGEKYPDWQVVLEQVKLLSATSPGEFPSGRPCPMFQAAAKAHMVMEADKWTNYKLTQDQIECLRDHMKRLYGITLIILMSQRIILEGIADNHGHNLDPGLFREVMDAGLKDCAAPLRSPTQDDRSRGVKTRRFANLIAMWDDIEEVKNPDTLETLQDFLKSNLKDYSKGSCYCHLPDKAIAEIVEELETLSVVSRTLSHSTMTTDPPSSSKFSLADRFLEKISRLSSRRSDRTAATSENLADPSVNPSTVMSLNPSTA